MYTPFTFHYSLENALSKLYNEKAEAAFRRYANRQETDEDVAVIEKYTSRKLTAAQATAIEDITELRYAVVIAK